MIFHLTIEYENGRREQIVSDPSWKVTVDRAHRPGQFKRWFLRSLQEEFAEQVVGWPQFTIEAPEGTIIELMSQEAHDSSKTLWLDSQFFNWSRFICREGVNRFEAFDFESLRWVQFHMGLSYPCNACWRYWALARLGRADVPLKELRIRWATMKSVVQNNTLQEEWDVQPDSCYQWSHCPAAPLSSLLMDIAGIRATAAGFARCQIRPQLADLADVELTYYTVRGPVQFAATREPIESCAANEPFHDRDTSKSGRHGRICGRTTNIGNVGINKGRRLTIRVPTDCSAELLLPPEAVVSLPELTPGHPLGLRRYSLKSGEENAFLVK